MGVNDEGFIYLDNAATTFVEPRVVEAMQPYFTRLGGNPSSSHRLGTVARVAVERARRVFMEGLKAWDGHLFFTSGGTEANNWALKGLVAANEIQHVITSPIEHASVLQPLQGLAKRGEIRLHFTALQADAHVDYEALESLLRRYPGSLVSLMHGNNELGNLTDLERVGVLCRQHGALLHSDLVQTVGYLPIDLSRLPVDACTFSAHKFHGPKGVGVLYVRNDLPIAPLLLGGTQEKGLRPGTENVPAIVGGGVAFQIALEEQERNRCYVAGLKEAMIALLVGGGLPVLFHGGCRDPHSSLPHILAIGLDIGAHYETLPLNFDLHGVAISAGSACMSGAHRLSHVLQAVGVPETRPVARFSFSKYNSSGEIEKVVKAMATFTTFLA